jgi:putative DNA primase/helicase
MTWENLLDKTAKGVVRTTLRNAAVALRQHPVLKGKLAFNEFADVAVVRGPLPWNQAEKRHWSEHDDLAATEWLQEQGIHVGSRVAHEAAQLVAYENRFHPVVEWLESLEWDQQARLETWFTTHLGVPASPIANAFGHKFLVSAVARVERPGCKVDHMPILEGIQGMLKSTALQTLVGDEWFADQIADLGTKDSAQDLRGKWVIELSELSAIRPHQVESVKAYVSRRVDHYRPSYGRRSADFPRQTVFVGTTNAKEFLSDGTGGRRFWPVQCTKIDMPAIIRDREQLWAEAVHCYHLGEKWWLTQDALTLAAEHEQELRRIEDPWEAIISDWLDQPRRQPDKDGVRDPYALKDDLVSNAEILEHAIGKPSERQGTADQMRVGRILARFGYDKKLHGKKRTCVWFKVETPQDEKDEVSCQGVSPQNPCASRLSEGGEIPEIPDARTHTGSNGALNESGQTSVSGVSLSSKSRKRNESQGISARHLGRVTGEDCVKSEGQVTHPIGTCVSCQSAVLAQDGGFIGEAQVIHFHCFDAWAKN